MVQIPLTQGQFALVDDEDYELVSAYKWCAHRQPHRASGMYNAVHTLPTGKTLLMHRLIMNPPNRVMIDHIDRNPLNNQRSNLRPANHSTNGANTGLKRNNKSGYKGVHWEKGREKWSAQLKTKEKYHHLGRYDTAKEAALAYNQAALTHFGEFASINEIGE